jgi:hypothetical protein
MYRNSVTHYNKYTQGDHKMHKTAINIHSIMVSYLALHIVKSVKYILTNYLIISNIFLLTHYNNLLPALLSKSSKFFRLIQ